MAHEQSTSFRGAFIAEAGQGYAAHRIAQFWRVQKVYFLHNGSAVNPATGNGRAFGLRKFGVCFTDSWLKGMAGCKNISVCRWYGDCLQYFIEVS